MANMNDTARRQRVDPDLYARAMDDDECVRCNGAGEVLVDPNNMSHLLFVPCPRCSK